MAWSNSAPQKIVYPKPTLKPTFLLIYHVSINFCGTLRDICGWYSLKFLSWKQENLFTVNKFNSKVANAKNYVIVFLHFSVLVLTHVTIFLAIITEAFLKLYFYEERIAKNLPSQCDLPFSDIFYWQYLLHQSLYWLFAGNPQILQRHLNTLRKWSFMQITPKLFKSNISSL